MGRILFIRVSAETYDEKDVPKIWPKLCAAVWPEPGVAGAGSPATEVRKGMGQPSRGVLALVDALVEYVQFGDISGSQKTALEGAVSALAGTRQKLDEALGNRNAQEAHELANSIEDTLDKAEKAME